MKRSQRILRTVQDAVLILIILLTMPLIWTEPLFRMPVLDGGRLSEEVAGQVLSDARAGAFGVTCGDPASIQVASMELVSNDGFLRAYGLLRSDAGTFPYAILAKRLPLSGDYLYDTRFRTENPIRIGNAAYFLWMYDIDSAPGRVVVEPRLLWGRLVVIGLSLATAARVAGFRRRTPRRRDSPSREEA